MFKCFYYKYLVEEGLLQEAATVELGKNSSKKLNFVPNSGSGSHRARTKYIPGGKKNPGNCPEFQIDENEDLSVEEYLDKIQNGELVSKDITTGSFTRKEEDWFLSGVAFSVYARPELLDFYNSNNPDGSIIENKMKEFNTKCGFKGMKIDGKKAIEVVNEERKKRLS